MEHFSHLLGVSSSQLTFIFFRGVGIPPTRYSYIFTSLEISLLHLFLAPEKPRQPSRLDAENPGDQGGDADDAGGADQGRVLEFSDDP